MNFFTPDPVDKLTITSSEIMYENTAQAYIKVSFGFAAHVQEHASSGAFVGPIKYITGSMDTFFPVQQQ